MTSASNNFDAYGVSIRWQLHDFIATSITAPSTSTTSSLSSISTGAETTTAAPSNTSHPASSTSSLSTGAKAGIGVGVAIGGILIILAGVFLLYIRPRQRRGENGNHGWHGYYRNKDHNAELTTTTPSTTRELYSHSLGELGNTPARRTAPPVELEGTRPPRVGRFEEDL
ncbi:uncharacterized protein TRUGW13939_06321 [Talaromyces rugulosus]|uniref:Mid2 domain-containing protein n=1 Tax=Talaromyces rugulosus TaxID=121627 RepID=A0A7H8QYL9_TALRU|nr:uncharacterized protein TRUGW13939_06321 [Talaromyces rugulosus]QKX59189.1 hypothetical protein TRUGW13939_06321 [Talaromyces rugulosus]